MANTYNIESQKLYSGASWKWSESPLLSPDSSFTLNIYLKLAANAAIILAGTPQSDGSYLFTKPASETAQIPSGDYSYQIVAVKDPDAIVIAEGFIHIYPMLTSSSYDTRGYWQKVYQKFQDAYLLAAERGWAEIEINGKTIRYTRDTLLKEMQNAEMRAKQETDSKSGQNKRKTILVAF